MKNQFVIGIGSQRAGSTLLHRILEQCSPVYMNPVKELHYFDTLFNVRSVNTLRNFSTSQLGREINHIVNAKNFAFMGKRYKNLLRTNFLLATMKVEDIEYIDLFRPCVMANHFLGEITPEYMILPLEGIRKMRETVGDNAKIILIARNPVKRFISAFKLLTHGHPNFDTSCFEENLLKTTAAGGEWMRVQDAFNDYESALIRYQQEFEHILLLSHDELFGAIEQTVEKLSTFLQMPISLENYQKLISTRFNSLSETADLSAETLSLLTTRYAKQQLYLDDVFGKDFCVA